MSLEPASSAERRCPGPRSHEQTTPCLRANTSARRPSLPNPAPRTRTSLAFAVLIAVLPVETVLANRWSDVSAPSHNPTRVIGKTSNGCIAGASTLPLEGTGYAVMHIERNRYYGHPNLIRTIQSLAHQVHERGLGTLHVGDLGQPRGGPMPSGHRSHQNGLDVDVWFDLDPRLLVRANPLRANLSAPSMLNGHRSGLDPGLWTDEHTQVLQLAASAPEVDRIFVNPHIKLDLCRRTRGDRDWLRVIRPWFGHDDHFHARLRCPPGDPACEPQDPPPSGDGCDSSLNWWLKQPLPPSKPQPVPIVPMPAECSAVLGAR